MSSATPADSHLGFDNAPNITDCVNRVNIIHLTNLEFSGHFMGRFFLTFESILRIFAIEYFAYEIKEDAGICG